MMSKENSETILPIKGSGLSKRAFLGALGCLLFSGVALADAAFSPENNIEIPIKRGHISSVRSIEETLEKKAVANWLGGDVSPRIALDTVIVVLGLVGMGSVLSKTPPIETHIYWQGQKEEELPNTICRPARI